MTNQPNTTPDFSTEPWIVSAVATLLPPVNRWLERTYQEIRRLKGQRDDLKREADRYKAAADELNIELLKVMDERNKVLAERNDLKAELAKEGQALERAEAHIANIELCIGVLNSGVVEAVEILTRSQRHVPPHIAARDYRYQDNGHDSGEIRSTPYPIFQGFTHE